MDTHILFSATAIAVALVAAILTANHNKKSITLSTETARKDREDMRVSDAQEKGVFLQRLDEAGSDVDKVGKIARANRDDIQQLKVTVSVSDERMVTVQRDIKTIVTKIDKLVELVVKERGIK